MGILKNVPIGIPPVEPVGVDVVLFSEKTQAVFASHYRAASEVIRLPSATYASHRSGGRVGWLWLCFREWALVKSYPHNALKFMSWSLASVDKRHSRFGHAIIAKNEFGPLDGQVGSQLPFRGSLGKRSGHVRGDDGFFGCLSRPANMDSLASHNCSLPKQGAGLSPQNGQGTNSDDNANYPGECECKASRKRCKIEAIFWGGRNDPYICLDMILGFICEAIGVAFIWHHPRSLKGWCLILMCVMCFLRMAVSLYRERQQEDCQNFPHNSVIVPRKYLDAWYLLGYSNNSEASMANTLNTDKQIAIIGALAEGSSIRAIERITGVHRDTIMRLGVRVGEGCASLMDKTMRDLPCTRLEMDEIWGFVGKKDRNVKMGDGAEVGSVWTFCAIDAETKLVPAFKVGDRDLRTTNAFVADLSNRMRNRIQLSSDAMKSYAEAVERSFGSEVDYGQIVKVFGHENASPNHRYSQPDIISCEKAVSNRSAGCEADFYQLCGAPERDHADAHAPSYSLDSGIQQEARKLRSGCRAALRLLQLCEASQHASLHPCDGRWRHW